MSIVPANYGEVLASVKSRVRSAQAKAALSVNTELIALYFEIGAQLSLQPMICARSSPI